MGVSMDCPIFFGYPLLSQEREKLRISNLASRLHSEGPSEQKPIKILEKRERGQGLPIFRVPLLSQERVKLYELQILRAHL